VSKRARGFSLVEVLCAILILGVGMVGLTQGLTTALRSSKETETQTAAALLAAARIETVRADGFILEGVEEGEGEEGTAVFRWQQTISGTDLAGLYDVKVIVQNASSGQPIFELQTLLFDPPLDSNANEPPQPRGRRGEGRAGERRRR
jgi:prepilin-type N-terminal cleavage/methylation domain-containing protein